MTGLRMSYLVLSLGLLLTGVNCFASIRASQPRWWRGAQWVSFAAGFGAIAAGIVLVSLWEQPLWLPR